MISLLIGLAAGAIMGGASPQAQEPEQWINAVDYPPEAVVSGHQGTVGMQLTVTPEGEVSICEVMQPSGYPILDKAACTAMLSRAHYTPGRDEAGNPIVSKVMRNVTWMLPIFAPRRDPYSGVDYVIQVSRLPDGKDQPMTIRQIVEADGTMSSCAADDLAISPKLVSIACAQIADAAPPVTDGSKQVRTLFSWTFLFTTNQVPERPVPRRGPTYLKGSPKTE